MSPLFEITFPFSNPVLIFTLVMAIIFLAPQLVSRVRIPGLVGIIVAGAIVGPSGLNWLERNDTMVLLGTIGLLYLMFVAGISLDLNRFNKLRSRSLLFGLVSFFVPQSMTVLVAIYLLDFGVPAALLLGSIIGSHTLIAYPIAARLGLMKNTAVTMTLGGTLITDTLSLAILAVVIATHGETPDMSFWFTFGGMVAVYLFLVLWGLPRLGYWFFRTVRNKPEAEFGFLMTVLFGTAYLGYFVGLAPIIGAFLAGLALNRLIPDQSTLMARVRFNGDALFIPFFLISVGLLIDFQVLLESLEIWFLALALILLVSLGKLAAAKIISRAYRYSKSESWIIFGLSVPQAAATLAVTLLGFDVGLFDTNLVNAVVVMILFTCVLGPWLVEKFGLVLAHEEENRTVKPSQRPERILIPLANPKTSNYLLDLALMIRDPDSEEPLFPLMIVSKGVQMEERVLLKHEKLKYAVQRAAEADVPVAPLTRIDMNIAHGIARTVQEERISMIIVGWNGEVSTRERIFGTVLDQLLEETKQMVFVNKVDHPLNTTTRIVLAVPPFAERGPGFFEAIHAVKLLAARVNADLVLICAARHLAHDRKLVEATKPRIDTIYEPIESWASLKEAFDRTVRDQMTHIVALSARRGTASWFSELDDLPRMLGKSYPENSFSIVYLAEIYD